MSNVNVLAREVSAKIVFYGPGLSGKTTTLKKIYESVRPSNRGEMMSLPTEADRTLFFDFLPVTVERIGDCAVRLALYTVPGQVFYNATRKLVLQGADGVVFVADSQPDAMERNRESLQNLQDNLLEHGLKLERFPVVFQWNKRDIPNCLPAAELHAQLNTRDAPEFETCATTGKGILDALKSITRLVIKDLRTKGVVAPRPKPTTPAALATSGHDPGLQEQLQQALDQQQLQPHVRGESIVRTVLAPPRKAAAENRAALNLLTALAPAELLDYARAADVAYARHDYPGCVRACYEAVRRALGYGGDYPLAVQSYLLRVDGGDLVRLEATLNLPAPSERDAAFALFVAMQSFVRLALSGIPSAS